jgi:hypothetical protein
VLLAILTYSSVYRHLLIIGLPLALSNYCSHLFQANLSFSTFDTASGQVTAGKPLPTAIFEFAWRFTGVKNWQEMIALTLGTLLLKQALMLVQKFFSQSHTS